MVLVFIWGSRLVWHFICGSSLVLQHCSGNYSSMFFSVKAMGFSWFFFVFIWHYYVVFAFLHITPVATGLFVLSMLPSFPWHYKQVNICEFSCQCPRPWYWWRSGVGPQAPSTACLLCANVTLMLKCCMCSGWNVKLNFTMGDNKVTYPNLMPPQDYRLVWNHILYLACLCGRMQQNCICKIMLEEVLRWSTCMRKIRKNIKQ